MRDQPAALVRRHILFLGRARNGGLSVHTTGKSVLVVVGGHSVQPSLPAASVFLIYVCKLASFTTEHKCDVDLIPVEARVYFVRKSAI
jgi:hypothetical protein